MLNEVVLMGRMTAEPELKHTTSGLSVTSFSLAVERNVTGKDGTRETDFINIVAWRQTAEFICKYFGKGQMIALTGSIQTRKYEDKNGNNRTAVEVLANHVYFTGDKREKDASSARSPGSNPSVGIDLNDFEDLTSDEDLPF